MIKDNLEKLQEICEIKVSYESHGLMSNELVIRSSRSCYNILNGIYDPDTVELYEEFKVLYLNRANRVIGYRDLSRGDYKSTVADVKLIISIALLSNSCGIILSHNHPSGNLQPSDSDLQLTDKIKTAAKYFDVELLDHIIFTKNGYLSFADEGHL